MTLCTIQPASLENERLGLEFDEFGHLTSFVSKRTGHNYAGGDALWRLYLQIGDELDIEVNTNESNVKPVITYRDDCRLIFRWSSLTYMARMGLVTQRRSLAIELEMEVSLPKVQNEDSDAVHWKIRLQNNEANVTIQETHFPLIKGLSLNGDQQLIWSRFGGEKISDIKAELRTATTEYFAPDHLFTSKTLNYPWPASTNCFTFAGEKESLYFGCHGDIGERTLHQMRLHSNDTLEAGFVRFPHIACGESFQAGTYVTAICHGDWHVAARIYSCWARTWFRSVSKEGHPFEVPQWVRRMNGWQRVIMQHQYGEAHYRFEDMPTILSDGMMAGVDTLFMFGWHQGGHDNNYPEYVPEKKLGGLDAMVKGIRHFRENGGRVILYSNGRLIDKNSQYYAEAGHHVCIKDVLGNEVRESYKFRGPGNYVYEHANRTMLPACPSCEEWYAVLQELADRALEWGCDSLFFDQIGSDEYPCCDPNHKHPIFWTGTARAKAENIRRIREYLRSHNPEVALGIELISDVTAQYVDYVHTLVGGCAVPDDWEQTGQKPVSRSFLEWFRYIFPEVIVSDREIRDDTDIERRVNHAVMLGLRSDVEIYRCRRTIASTPYYSSYLAKINQLRQRQAHLLLEGRYIDTDCFTLSTDEVDARAFKAEDDTGGMAIVITQSHLPRATVVLTQTNPKLHFGSSDGVGAFKAIPVEQNRVEVELSRHALVVLVFAPVA